MKPEFKIQVSPWAGGDHDCWFSEVRGLLPLFSYIGGGCLDSSYGDYWIEGDESGEDWRLWQTYHYYEDMGDEEEDEEDDEEDEVEEDEVEGDEVEEIIPSGDRIFLSAYCVGHVLTPEEAAKTLLKALWQAHKDRGYDHPNMLDSVSEGALLTVEDVEAIIHDVFG